MGIVTTLLLENEMDIIVAQRRMMKVAEYFTLNISTQTTIGTAVAEVCRVVIDKTDTGKLEIRLDRIDAKYFLTGEIFFQKDIEIRSGEEGLRYARMLVPTFEYSPEKTPGLITVRIGIPRSFHVNEARVKEAAAFFTALKPSTPYEQLKLRNNELSKQAQEKDEALLQKSILDEKKNEFISVASHELKTPLTTLKAFTQLAMDASKDNNTEKQIRYIAKISSQVNKLHVLIQQLLDISKIESGKLDYQKEPTVMQEYMDGLLPVLENLVPLHRLNWVVPDRPLPVLIDRLRMEQVFTNLVSNAAKYSEQETEININSQVNNNTLTLTVADEGMGIPAESLERIFEKYYRDDSVASRYSGFGMGLYITAGIVREHGGKIWASNRETRGAAFSFTLPLMAAV